MTRSETFRKVDLAGRPHYLVDDVAKMLGKHRRTVIRWMDDGKLTRVYYDTRAVCIPADEVDELRKELEAEAPRPKPSPRPSDVRPKPKPGDGPPRNTGAAA